MSPFQGAEYAAVALSLFLLTAAAISDLKTREVSDKIWFVYAPVGLALTAFRILVDPSVLLLSAVSAAFSILVAFGFVFFGLCGGADAKALICLGLTLPTPPGIMNTILGFVHPFYPVVVVVTGFLCSFSVAIWMLGRNLALFARYKSKMFEGLDKEPTWKKALAFFTGYPAKIEKLQSTFYLYPMEKVVEDVNGAHRTLAIYTNADVDRAKVLSDFNASIRKVDSVGMVWVTPGLPMLVFILFATVITLIIGDPIFGGIFLLRPH